MSSLIIFMGATGAGKSFMAERLHDDFGWAHISSGQLLREQLQQSDAIARGELAPSQLVEGLIRQAVSGTPQETTIILDGFPRIADEAQYLETACREWGRMLDAVVFLRVSLEVSEQRLQARGRGDDTALANKAKWHEFQTETIPVIESYRQAGLLQEVSANDDGDLVYDRIKKVLKL